jgi:hypothetical protein
MDIALNANDPAQRARGDAIFDRVMRNPEQFGAQEMLWRGYIWSWNRRGEGKRGPGVQQAAHMNHVHLGIDVNAGRNWNESWVSGGPGPAPGPSPEEDDLPYTEEDLVRITNNGVLRALEGVKARQLIYQTVEDALLGKAPAGGDTDIQNTVQELVVAAISTPRGQAAIKKAIEGE